MIVKSGNMAAYLVDERMSVVQETAEEKIRIIFKHI